MPRRPLIAVFLTAALMSAAGFQTTPRRPTPQSELAELQALLAIPNVSTSQADIGRNAERLQAMFRQRGFQIDIVRTAHSPVLIGALEPAGRPARTLTFYFHYDGQPVTPSEWRDSGPFQPIFRNRPLEDGGRVVKLAAQGPVDPDWRLYARSAADDKGPIVAFLSALDEARAAGQPVTSTIRVLLEGDEEAGSPVLADVVSREANRIRGDLVLIVDGPRHPSGLPTFAFGSRGIVQAELTVFTARRDLHSGNYGNWAPNAALELAALLASMKDPAGHVTIPGFYDDVAPLTSEEQRAIAAIPDMDATLMRRFGFAKPETAGARLETLDNRPTLNVSGLGSGTVTGQGRTVIPGEATARMDLRLVRNIDPDRQFARLRAYIEARGFHLIAGDAPTESERTTFATLARLRRIGGYPAGRTPLTNALAQQVVSAVGAATHTTPARLPSLGGSTPFYLFSDRLKSPTVVMPVVNFDDNQHGPNENLRLGNFFDAVTMMRAIVTMR